MKTITKIITFCSRELKLKLLAKPGTKIKLKRIKVRGTNKNWN